MTDPIALRVLTLPVLARGSGSYGASLAEAAAFCLESNGHGSGVLMTLEGVQLETPERIAVAWDPLETTARSTWNDKPFATEQAAYGIAILLIGEVTDWEVVERSRKGTGFDFWLSSGKQPFEAKLEVSGILEGSRGGASSRARKKARQIEKSNTSIPGYIVVVEFSEPYSLLVKE